MIERQIEKWDVVIIGAGGAGMMCAIHAGRRGRSVMLLDHSAKIGGKILISGGGRCNFTNVGAGPANYVSRNPHFAKSALSRYPPSEFIAQVEAHGIAYHEKKLGQLFCDVSAKAIVELLETQTREACAEIRLESKVETITKPWAAPEFENAGARFRVDGQTPGGTFTLECESLVIATGGFSIPKIGATGFGYRIAKEFGLRLVETEAALDGFTFSPDQERMFRELAGVSVDCVIRAGDLSFRENILFTHSGLSGPAALQASLHWRRGESVVIDLLPGVDLQEFFRTKKREGSRSLVRTLLAEVLPARFATKLCELHFPSDLPLPQVSERALETFIALLHAWELVPNGTVGYSKAEVTRGGVNTDELSSKTMEAKKVPGLYFIGEVVDVTGWLGGYNFQWAWASGHAAGLVV